MKITASIAANSTRLALLAIMSLACGCANKNFYPATPLVSDVSVKSGRLTDSVLIQAGRQYRHSNFYHSLLGSHYREVWATPVKVRVLDFKKEKGGLEVQKLSGSLQTLGLTLTDRSGKTYALRSLDKDPATNTSPLIKKTFGVNFLRDQTAALNPYAALVVAPLAQAAGIPQPTPELVYVRKEEPALGKFMEKTGDRVYMLEEKYDTKKDIPATLDGAENLAGTKKMLRKIYEEGDHLPDQLAFARARLFDILINDRDRHKDQWEWAVFKEKENTIYRPIAKDRDQAFYNYDKGFTSLLLGRLLNMQKFLPFRANFRNLHALTVKSEFIDPRLLNQVTSAQFDSIAKELQLALTDRVIEEAVLAYPEEVYQLTGRQTVQKLMSRRDKLTEAAAGYYNILAKEVMVVGSDDEEVFEVKRLNDEQTEVTVHLKSDNRRVYHRIFNHAETKKLLIFGLGDDDVFNVSGSARKGIIITIVGGEGEDEITDTSQVAGRKKHTLIYDTKLGNELKLGPESKNNTSRCVTVHSFDREGY